LAGILTQKRHATWAVREKVIDLPSARTAYVDQGIGFPVVFLHGLMGYSFCWRKNIEPVARDFRTIAIDFAGCGYSGPLRTGEYGVEVWSRQLEELLDALAIPVAHLVGSSAGGAVALEFASRRPDRVAGMALAAPVTAFSRRAVRLSRLYSLTGMPKSVVSLLVRNAPTLMPWLFRHRYYSDPARITPETIPGYIEGIRAEVTVPMLRQAIRGWDGARLKHGIERVKAPTLLIWGDEDKLVPAVCASELAAALPSSQIAVLRGTGHFCYEEMPDEFNRLLLKFLTAVQVRC
jgi:pimeloyl-ACP methyl ester carboxylesterase